MGATVFASRSESTALLQSQVMGQDSRVERSEYLNSMKQQFMDYAKNGVPAEAIPFLNTVKDTLQNNVLSLITDERDAHFASHGTLAAAFGAAATTYSGTNDGITATEAPAAATAKQTHTDCRGLESTDFTEKTDAQTAYDATEATVRSRADATVACLEETYNWRDSANLGTYETELQQYKAAVTALIGTRDSLDDRISELNTQRGVCDGNQATFEQDACALTIAQAESNNVYVNAYNGAKSAFEAQFATWVEQNTDRQLQCQLVNTLICYIDGLATHDDQAALQGAVDACETGKNSHDCSAVEFTHDATPGADGLSNVPAAPCTAGFDHGTMPAGTVLNGCAVCSGVPAAAAFD